MTQRNDIITVYVAGVVQGVALVAFPAASAIFTDPKAYGLSSTEYGGMFVPQAILAILSSLLGAEFENRLGTKRIYRLGLSANLLAMVLLAVSGLVMHEHSWAYGVLLAATACMGTGFGLTVPALNTFASAFFPKKNAKAVLGLNALLGLGTALAPVFVALFVRLGFWWGLPVLVGLLIFGLLLLSIGQALKEGAKSRAVRTPGHGAKVPARFWIFASFTLLYGICETMNGNWASLYMTNHFGAGPALASLALSIFWGMVTVGRVFFAAIEKWFSERLVCRVLPLVLTAAFVASACAPKTSSWLGIMAFALAGLGCSALLPLAIGFGQKELTAITASVAGGLIAFYQIGYGIAAFCVGPLQKRAGLDLKTIYGGTAVAALALAALSLILARRPPASVKI